MFVRFTDDAEKDLEALGDHIALESPSRALNFVRELRVACMSLAEFPNRSPLIPRYAK